MVFHVYCPPVPVILCVQRTAAAQRLDHGDINHAEDAQLSQSFNNGSTKFSVPPIPQL